jgi:hypothetical protein
LTIRDASTPVVTTVDESARCIKQRFEELWVFFEDDLY